MSDQSVGDTGEVEQSNSESTPEASTGQMEKLLERDLSGKSSVEDVWVGQADSGCNIAIVTVAPARAIFTRELTQIKAVLDVWGKIVYTNETEAKNQPPLSDISAFDWLKSQLGIEPIHKQIKFIIEISDPLSEIQREVEQINTFGAESG